jgi:flagellar biogenesis protein FliO
MQNTGIETMREGSGESRAGVAAIIRAGLRRVFAKLGQARGERRMELVERMELGGRRQLLLVVCDGQRYLVGTSSDGVHAIAAMRAQPEVRPCADEEMRCDS